MIIMLDLWEEVFYDWENKGTSKPIAGQF